MRIRPQTIKSANRIVARWHRHNNPVQGGLFACGVERNGELIGVAIVGRPISKALDDGTRCEVLRVASRTKAEGGMYACSALYGACVRAAKALGYDEVITYTLASEPGTSLRAAGFKRAAAVKGEATWSRPSRSRRQVDLFGCPRRPAGDKVRWSRTLTRGGCGPGSERDDRSG